MDTLVILLIVAGIGAGTFIFLERITRTKSWERYHAPNFVRRRPFPSPEVEEDLEEDEEALDDEEVDEDIDEEEREVREQERRDDEDEAYENEVWRKRQDHDEFG